MKNKSAFLFLICCLAYQVAGCGGKEATEESTPTTAPSATPSPQPTEAALSEDSTLSFTQSKQFSEPAHNWDIALGDLDGDSDLDAFTTNDHPQGQKIWFNDGQGQFTASKTILEPCLRVALGDLDHDNDLDLVITNWNTEKENWLSSASVWLNDGAGNFTKSQGDLGGEEVFNMALQDLNNDGHLDIFFVGIGLDTVWMNNGDGTFKDSGQKLTTGIDAAVALGDLDLDGDMDALTGGWEGPAKLWLNDGTGQFSNAFPNMTGPNLHIHDLALGDFDSDGDLDAFLALANGEPHQVWFNDGTGNYSIAQTLPEILAHGVALGDVDNDNDLDAVTAHGSPGGGYLRIWLNDGKGSFTDSLLELGEGFSSAVSLGDLNKNSKLDIIATFTTWGGQGDGASNSVWFNAISSSMEKKNLIRSSDGMKMIHIPSGRFLMGSTEIQIEDAIALCNQHYSPCNGWFYERESPQHIVSLDAYWLDQTEVSNSQYQLCVEGGICQAPTTCRKGEATFDDPEKADHPVVCIAWDAAKTYCEWVGARLPTEAEWEYAFRGASSLIYPWGDEFEGFRVNYCDLNCSQPHADERFDDGYAQTAPVGSYPSGVSWAGIHDLSGNVAEWTADWFEEYTSDTVSNPTGAESGTEKMIKGCSWFFNPAYCRGALRPAASPDTSLDYLGFRCALSANEG